VTTPPSELNFEPPGPGTWVRDQVHFPRPVTRYWTDTHPDAFARGTADMCSFYGLLLGRMVMQYPNGFAYTVREPAPDDEIPARFARASEVLANKMWREQLREWDEVSKPNAIAVHRELQAIDPDTLSDAELATYVMHCRDHHARMITQHMRYTGSAVIPVGDLMAHLMAWTQVPAADVLAMMAGAAPVSAGASAELERLIAAFQGNDDARAQLAADGDPAGVLAELRARDDDVGRALDEYLDLVGCRLLDGFDIAGRYALELPDALLRAIRSAVGTGGSGADDVEARIAAVRDQVPEEHRAEFDELLGEARLMYRLRDERGVFSDIWASGLMRRAALGAGRRLAASGRVHDPEHIIDATADEMAQMVMGAGGPTADELAERFAARTAMTGREGPPFLGDPPTPPPDMEGLPPDVIRVMTATGIAIGALFGSSEAEHEENLLRGLAASGGSYEGVARRIEGPHEFDRIQQGDVLVTESTSEAFNILLPLLGAIVTDAGGLLSHSAIVAREYGIPGVVGTRDATQLIPDGARVRVDGDAGEVHVFA
jgi:phosphohistidine swiveling domain-containing protein